PSVTATTTPTATATATATAAATCSPVITHSTSETIEDSNSASCNSGAPKFFHVGNSYWRSFDMATFAGSREYNVSSVSFGIEAADAGPNQTQPLTVRLHRQTSGIFPGGT